MLPKTLFDRIMNVSHLLRELELTGMHIEIGSDFARYRRYRSSQPDRNPVYPMFDIASSYIDETNGFWVCGFDETDTLIHTQAVRLLDLSGVALGRHLETHRHKYISPDTTPDPDLTFYSGPGCLETITGRVCYHGEFWLPARGLGGLRSKGATSVLSRILFEVMVGSWEPDFVFALVPNALASKGAHLRYGYSHCEPGRWIGPDRQTTEEDHLIWMSARELARSLAREPQKLQYADKTSTIRSHLAPVEAKT